MGQTPYRTFDSSDDLEAWIDELLRSNRERISVEGPSTAVKHIVATVDDQEGVPLYALEPYTFELDGVTEDVRVDPFSVIAHTKLLTHEMYETGMSPQAFAWKILEAELNGRLWNGDAE
ncbi:hypothetical protein [Halosegnis longus]|uniref:hypothetical protein n=1 Tax=Halosegnis longus TaxID=2216012 RepID=UPI00129EA354|nr:hypothetical protein [Halosegnis longus]